MKRLRNASAILAAAALFGFGLSSCDYTGDTTFDAALAANTASSSGGSGSGSANDHVFDFSTLTSTEIKDLTGETAASSTGVTITNGASTTLSNKAIVVRSANATSSNFKVGVSSDKHYIDFGSNAATADSTPTVGSTVTLLHSIKFPVTSGKKYKVTINTNNKTNATGNGNYACLTDSEGKVLALKLIESTKNDVEFDAFTAGETVSLSLYRTMVGTSASGHLYVGIVTFKEITTDVKVTGITVSAAGSATSVKINKTLQLSTTVTPSNATSSSVTWTSSDTSKATVSSSGLVTGVAAGSVTITAKATDGSNVTGTIDLTVEAGSDELSETSITVNRAATSAATKSFTLTLGTTQFNAAGLSALVADFDISSYITESSTTNLTISDAKVTSAATTSTLAFQFKVATTAASGTTGKIKVTIPANVLVSGSAIEKEISYSVVEQTSATAKTYNFVGLNPAAAFVNESSEAVTLEISSSKSSLPSTVKKIVTSAGNVGVTSAGDGKFQIQTTEATGGTVTSVNLNTCSLSTNSIPANTDTVTISNLVNVLSFPVDGAGTVTVTATIGASSKAADADSCVAALYDGSGNKICVSDSVLAKNGGTPTLTGTVSDATTVYIVFFRSEGKGSLKVTKIDVAP